MALDDIGQLASRLRGEVSKAVVGLDTAIDLLLVALLSEGHVLLEAPPGTAKTLLARAFSAALDLKFSRIQFTPDLMPGDVLGTNLFNFQTNEFTLSKGPVFTEMLLADEINRTPPKTQAALLEAMNERAVTIDGATIDLGAGFMVVATQNPIEQQGTYPLPEAQLDRFLFKYDLPYPDRDQERAIVERHGQQAGLPKVEDFAISAVADLEAVRAARRTVAGLRLEPEVAGYVVDLVRATREAVHLQFGASPRAAATLAAAARAAAALDGRDYVLPDDVKRLAPHALGHRVVLSPAAEIDGLSAARVVATLLEQVPAPR